MFGFKRLLVAGGREAFDVRVDFASKSVLIDGNRVVIIGTADAKLIRDYAAGWEERVKDFRVRI